jgi:SagB-type dehydrogenase family enzyme
MTALAFHEATKHYFNRFARSAGHLDWATQPDPFRRYAGARRVSLPRDVLAADVPYDALFDSSAPVAALSDAAIATFLRCSLGLSAWKQFRSSRWALRVNPSSGNLHPTEAYLIRDGRVCHYAPREHALEERCVLDARAWAAYAGINHGFLVGLTSIHWREAWKYGERAFRYCQHDCGHAIAALRFAAALLGWRLALLPQWSDPQIAAVLGTDRDDDFAGAEREEPECIAWVAPTIPESMRAAEPGVLVEAATASPWSGRANALSPARVEWPLIDEVARATRRGGDGGAEVVTSARASVTTLAPQPPTTLSARQIILQRRSAVAFDARSTLPRERFLAMLARTKPDAPPFDAIDWPPHIHVLLFVHRVEGLTPGVYAYLRDPAVLPEWRAAMRPEFLWERMNERNDPNDPNDPNGSNGSNGSNDLYLLLPFDVTWVANRVSCDQDIASDGFFSLGMVARLESALRERGEWFYRRVFWESGILGQVLYLEAEAAGARATGIGCFYDDPVHDAAGLAGMEWQSIYHFSVGVPVDDDRLTTEPGYDWESAHANRDVPADDGVGGGA